MYEPTQQPKKVQTSVGNPLVTLKTNKGDIVLELFMDKTPVTTGNFLKLAREGFYDGTKFHRVIPNFMIQGGDPNTKGEEAIFYGIGGPGYTIQDEFATGLSNVRGTIAMANTGQPNSGGSQFFINLIDNIGLDFDKPPLTSNHPVFGHVVQGMDVVDAIANVKTGPRDIPIEPVVITSVAIRK
ncbi:MAG: peptidylprolyl isomerase [Candidatus Sungbacteria bacterium RIFCSPHIGHO2_02_FULL_47_11]|uniref:Peptidyl-prolyl cis-trans isomerase n=1 Tax=Candidatus Sungbacteria bacterium RIFCSPHIGHO2_02_FULL_47_11 TaxID=1802270 RepID=A0A1G2KNV4_9BACT|nr:MAG: peptidylprolyl isomerase [Candidatus Sungbacteria bacterium RIFCSPHIGHO2_02_FULL_47_11]